MQSAKSDENDLDESFRSLTLDEGTESETENVNILQEVSKLQVGHTLTKMECKVHAKLMH